MSDQTPTPATRQDLLEEIHQRIMQNHRAPVSPEMIAARERLDRMHRDHLTGTHAISDAWSSPAVAAVSKVVTEDGNVPFRPFVTHAGGILAVLDLVDDRGRADTRRIVPLIDELFAQNAVQEFAGGMTITRKPRNRPYPHNSPEPKSAVTAGGRDPGANDAEELLRQEAEAANRPRTTASR